MIVPVVLPDSTVALSSSLVTRPSRPAPPPLQVDTAKAVLVGAALWVVALVVLLLLGDRVDRTWIWTCVCGIVLAGLGLALMRWQGQIGPRSRRPSGDRDGSAS